MAATIARIPSEPHYLDTFWYKYVLSVAAAAVAETATYPLDIVKTRLQVQGEMMAKGHKVQHRGFFRTLFGIVREEGIVQLWKGLPPAIYRHLIYSGCRMNLYEAMRNHFLRKNGDRRMPLWQCVMVGVVAGGFGQFLASPTDLVKVQMQTEGRRRLMGLPPRVESTWKAFKKIASEGGVRGLWKGCTPNIYRAALVNLGDLTTYDTGKRLVLQHTSLEDNYVTHSLASGMSGLVAATLATPADVIRTRVMNQPTDDRGRGLLYKSPLDCLMKTVRGEGFIALYKGFFPIWARMAPWSFTFWITYEELRRFSGVSSF
ncbi:mitochondrial uncoupling protein 4-like [Ornithodoros turicata]|uniref:mitochondrial uncoupling protein 4-like n=1 Tax=Ornithodoros turicata TaxID=34597 RepID=UPI003138CAE6